MKHTYTSAHVALSAFAVFSMTFTAGLGAGTALVDYASGDGLSLQAVVTSTRQTVEFRAQQRRRLKGVLLKKITRPSTRNGTGSRIAPVEKPDHTQLQPVKTGCGDKLVLLTDECDDGNTVANDGCSAACKIEAGYQCSGQPSRCWSTCGDGVVSTNEKCDDGNLNGGDGCSGICKIEIGYTCKNSPSTCEKTPYCGDGVKASTEACDDGNSAPGDGCFECKVE